MLAAIKTYKKAITDKAVANNISRKEIGINSIKRSGIQAKLTIGQPNDKYEQEADSVADRVMTMPEPAGIQRSCASCTTDELQTKPLFQAITPFVQRQIEEEEEEPVQAKSVIQRQTEEEEEPLQTKPDLLKQTDDEEEEPIMAKTNNSGTQTATPLIENRINRSKGQGSPLADNIRSFMENRFGSDFSHVRIHNDNDAIQLNRQLNSQAFTKGSDIYFNSGKYNPGSSSGKHLLAHELTHVVQQKAGLKSKSNFINKLIKGNSFHQRRIIQSDNSRVGISSNMLVQQNSNYPIVMRSCYNPKTLKNISGCTGISSVIKGERFLFVVNCDNLKSGEKDHLRYYINMIKSNEMIDIHGFASIDGPARFNNNLSCLRAQKVENLIAKSRWGVSPSQIGGIFMHGATPGPKDNMRSVVIVKRKSPFKPPPSLGSGCAYFPCLGKSRCLTQAERRLASGIFGSSLDFNRIRVSNSLGAGGAKWVNYSKSPLPPYSSGTCLNLGGGASNATLIHELTHSWQSQHHSNPMQFMVNSAVCQAMAKFKCGNVMAAYRYRSGLPFHHYSAEQIAEIVEDHYKGVSGLGRYVSIIAGTSKGAISVPNVVSLATDVIGPC